MNKIGRRHHMATRLTSASERARYGEEWQSDIRSSDPAGESAERIKRERHRLNRATPASGIARVVALPLPRRLLASVRRQAPGRCPGY
jgi:hypothetical protein